MLYECSCGCGEPIDNPNAFIEGHKSNRVMVSADFEGGGAPIESYRSAPDSTIDHEFVGKFARIAVTDPRTLTLIGLSYGAEVQVTGYHPSDGTFDVCLINGATVARHVPTSWLTSWGDALANYIAPSRIISSADEGLTVDDHVADAKETSAGGYKKPTSAPAQYAPVRSAGGAVIGIGQSAIGGRRLSLAEQLEMSDSAADRAHAEQVTAEDEREVLDLESVLKPVIKGASKDAQGIGLEEDYEPNVAHDYMQGYPDEEEVLDESAIMAELQEDKLDRLREYRNLFSQSGACPNCREAEDIMYSKVGDKRGNVDCYCKRCEVRFVTAADDSYPRYTKGKEYTSEDLRDHSSRAKDSLDGVVRQTTFTGTVRKEPYDTVVIDAELAEIERELGELDSK